MTFQLGWHTMHQVKWETLITFHLILPMIWKSGIDQSERSWQRYTEGWDEVTDPGTCVQSVTQTWAESNPDRFVQDIRADRSLSNDCERMHLDRLRKWHEPYLRCVHIGFANEWMSDGVKDIFLSVLNELKRYYMYFVWVESFRLFECPSAIFNERNARLFTHNVTWRKVRYIEGAINLQPLSNFD